MLESISDQRSATAATKTSSTKGRPDSKTRPAPAKTKERGVQNGSPRTKNLKIS